MTATYLDRLAARMAAVGTCLCVGLDPDPGALPEGFGRDLAGVEAFSALLLDAAAPHAAAIKANLAFFEAFGAPGIAALERLRARLPADLPFIADAKRGDIGTTAAKQAVALYDVLGADAVTANPYLGAEAIAPLIDRTDRFVYALCRTSNPGAGELQGLVVAAGHDPAGVPVPAEPLYARVARRATAWGPGGTVGLVVGATAPVELRAIRAIAPGLPFLVPGIGAQGGDLAAVLADGPATKPPAGGPGHPAGSLLVNVSRGIAGAPLEPPPPDRPPTLRDDVGGRLSEAARAWAARMPVLR